MNMVKEEQMAATSPSNGATQVPNECKPDEDIQGHRPGKSQTGRKKWNKRRNKKAQLQKAETQDHEHLDDVRTPMVLSVKSSRTTGDNSENTPAQAQRYKMSVEPEVQRGVHKPNHKGRKKDSRRRKKVKIVHEMTRSNRSSCPQEENSPPPKSATSNSGEVSENASPTFPAAIPKQNKRGNRNKGQRKGKRCDALNSQRQPNGARREAGLHAQTPVLDRQSAQDKGLQQELLDKTNQLPADYHGSNRELGAKCPKSADSPKSRGNARLLRSDSNGTKRKQTHVTASSNAANGQKAVIKNTFVLPRMASFETDHRTESNTGRVGENSSIASIKGAEISAQCEPGSFPPATAQNYTSSQDVRNEIKGSRQVGRRHWKSRRHMNRS